MAKTEGPSGPLAQAQIFEAARRAYEASRVKLGAAVALAVALVPLASMGLGGPRASAAVLGAFLIIGVGALVWRGGSAARSGMSGLEAGLVPLLLAHAANLYGHVCLPGQGCSSLCVPACAAGGLVAGLLVERAARTSPKPRVVRTVGGTVAFMTGALGCSCVGSAGLVGLLSGMAFTLIASRLVERRAA